MKIQRYRPDLFYKKMLKDNDYGNYIDCSDVNHLLNPWKDAEKDKPEFQGNYFLELIDDCGHKVNDIGFFFHGEFLPCSLRKAYDNGILKVIRWMHIPKNEGEE